MKIPTDFLVYAQWSGILTLLCLILTILAFVLSWGIRFRLVGITAFLGVLTASIFALKLGLYTRTEIPGAVRYSLVYDNGNTQAVIVVPPQIEQSAIAPTLEQAAADLFSYGRTGVGGENNLTIKLRTLLHPEPGLSQPLYLGQVKRSLSVRDDENMQVEVFSDNVAQLPETISQPKNN